MQLAESITPETTVATGTSLVARIAAALRGTLPGAEFAPLIEETVSAYERAQLDLGELEERALDPTIDEAAAAAIRREAEGVALKRDRLAAAAEQLRERQGRLIREHAHG